MVQGNKSISMDGCKHSWDEIDQESKKLGVDRSKFMQILVMKYFSKPKKLGKVETILFSILLWLALITIILLLMYNA